MCHARENIYWNIETERVVKSENGKEKEEYKL